MLADARRLVQEISDCLKHPDPAREGRLAEDFAALCRAATLRLQQCVAMLQAGDPTQALQLAESPPALLDLLTVLGFRESAQWRRYCQEHQLAVPQAFDSASIRRLNEAYSTGIDANHPLYRDYRQAVMRRDDDQALSVLRLIVKLNAADTNAPKELERLMRKAAAAKWQRLKTALDANEEKAVLDGLADLENLGISPDEEPALWQRGQAVKCETWMRELRPLHASGNWREATGWVKRIDEVRTRHDVPLPALVADDLADIREWVERETRKDAAERQFQKLSAELGHVLDLVEDKHLSTRRRDLTELRADLDSLTRKWQEIQRMDRALPEDTEFRFEKYYRMLRHQIAQREKTNKLIFTSVAIAILVVATLVGMKVMDLRRAGQLAGELAQHEQGRQVLAAERFISQIHSNDERLVRIPKLGAALNATEQFIAQERDRRQVLQGKIDALMAAARGGFQGLSPDGYQAQLEEARALKEQLAEDFQSEASDRLIAFQAEWEGFLFAERKRRADAFQERLGEAEALANEALAFRNGPDAVSAGLAKLDTRVPALEEATTPPLESLALPQELTLRFNALTNRMASYERKVVQWKDVNDQLAAPETLASYLAALQGLQGNEFAALDHVRKAREVLSLNPSGEAIFDALVAFGDPQIATAAREGKVLRLYPDEIAASERAKVAALRDDPNVKALHRYQLTDKARAEGDTNRVRVVYTRDPLQRNKLGRMEGDVFDPLESPDAFNFVAKAYANVDYELEEVEASDEVRLVDRVAVLQIIDGNTGQFRLPLLQVIDGVDQDTTANPVFRAWLVMRLADLIAIQPTGWGIPWARSYNDYTSDLAAQGAGSIRSGDWLVPNRVAKLGPALEKVFARYRSFSFEHQAQFVHELARRAAQDGFSFSGYVSPDTAAPTGVSDTPMNRSELWGWSGSSRQPAMLFRYSGAMGYSATAAALPFSPLLVFRADREHLPEIVADAVGFPQGRQPGNASLPKLFQN